MSCGSEQIGPRRSRRWQRTLVLRGPILGRSLAGRTVLWISSLRIKVSRRLSISSAGC